MPIRRKYESSQMFLALEQPGLHDSETGLYSEKGLYQLWRPWDNANRQDTRPNTRYVPAWTATGNLDPR